MVSRQPQSILHPNSIGILYMWKKSLVLGMVSIVLISCKSGFVDLSNDLPAKEISQLREGKYRGIAWAGETALVVNIDKGSLFENQRMCSQQSINIFDLKTRQLQQLPLPFGDECKSYIIRNLQLLPNQHAGYIFEIPDLSSISIKSVDVVTSSESDIFIKTSSDIPLDRFSYSPDMNELLLVDVQSPLIKSELYLLNDNKVNSITPEFLRADFPAWSKENLVAFFATKPYPGSGDPIKHWYQTENQIDYPWQLYLYYPSSKITEELPLNVIHPAELKWSPDGSVLAFSGEYKGVEGVWLVSNLDMPENLTVTRIVNGLATFDFSPNGKSIAFAYIGLQNPDRQNILYIVDLPD